MTHLCPECAHWIYGYENCRHQMLDGKCAKCHWDGSRSPYVGKLILANKNRVNDKDADPKDHERTVNNPIPFDFHDSTITDFVNLPNRDVEIMIAMYPVFYPDIQTVKILLSGIFNEITVKRYFRKMAAEWGEECLSCRIDNLHYDNKEKSSPGHMHLFLATEIGNLKIHCKQMEFEVNNAKGRQYD